MDQDDVSRVALADAEANGIVFLDEIDKIAVSDVRGGSVSREGVQRDLLPLIEGTTVATKYGPMKTDHILFIASGAFHVAKPSDMLPELQGRLPIRVELKRADRGGFRPRSCRDTRANLAAAVPGADRHRGRHARIHRRRHPRGRPHRRRSERERREYRRAAAADGDGKAARGGQLRRRGPPGRDAVVDAALCRSATRWHRPRHRSRRNTCCRRGGEKPPASCLCPLEQFVEARLDILRRSVDVDLERGRDPPLAAVRQWVTGFGDQDRRTGVG